MAANTGRKRIPVKHIRDGIKSNYKKDCKCQICDSEESLEAHHYTSVSLLFHKYVKERDIDISTDDKVIAMRDQFYKDNWYDLVDNIVTLCATHHKLLHRVYGKEPALHTNTKQEAWVQKQKDKHNGVAVKGRFSQLI